MSPPDHLTRWLLDTRGLWPGATITDSASARSCLALLPPQDQLSVTRKYHVADARMALASALLKRLFVHTALGLAWRDIAFERRRDAVHGKPSAVLPSGEPAPVEFNLSHQAGLVALVGCTTADGDPEVEVALGVDVVCVNERGGDMPSIRRQGFPAWLDTYADVFGAQELSDMALPGGDALLPAQLRRFYAYWAYKEAFVKLDGDALLATWLRRLEFRNVRAPDPGLVPGGVWGERVCDAEVWFSGAQGDAAGPRGVQVGEGERRRLEDTRVQIVGFEDRFMIAVAARGLGGEQALTEFRVLDFEREVWGVVKAA